jgi:hypothetical protein
VILALLPRDDTVLGRKLMGSLIVYPILAALIPAVFVGEVAAQQVDPAAIAKVNREILTRLQGTKSVEAKPQFVDGRLWACVVEFSVIERDWVYKQGAHIRVGGSFGVANQGKIGVMLKVILHDIDVRTLPVTFVPSPPASAYFTSGNSTTKDDVVSAYPSDIPGAIFVVLQPENALKLILDGFTQGKVGIAFARKKGSSDIQMAIDTTVVETKDDGSRVRSKQPQLAFLDCVDKLIK